MFGTGNFYEKERRAEEEDREEEEEEEKGGRSGPGHPARRPPRRRRRSFLRVKPFGHNATTDRPGELGPWAREEKFGNEVRTSRSDIPLKLGATALE